MKRARAQQHKAKAQLDNKTQRERVGLVGLQHAKRKWRAYFFTDSQSVHHQPLLFWRMELLLFRMMMQHDGIITSTLQYHNPIPHYHNLDTVNTKYTQVMAGGEGAKERRRLKRLEQTAAGGDSSGGVKKEGASRVDEKKVFQGGSRQPRTGGPAGKWSSSNKGSISNDKPTQKFARQGRGPGPDPKRLVAHKKNAQFAKPKIKKNKPKKPKHLKRKLEQTEDEAERERVRKELEAFQSKKAKLSKTTHAVANEQPSRASFDFVTTQDFPRTSPQTKTGTKPPVEKRITNVVEDGPASSSDSGSGNTTAVLVGVDVVDSNSKETTQKTSDRPAQSPGNDGYPSSSQSNSDSDEDSNSDNDEGDVQEKEEAPKRERGRRRRGRKDTARLIEESQTDAMEPETKNQKNKEGSEARGLTCLEEKERYCLGRKPVTDFEVGKKYPGRVVYIKSFGVFFDIGCHSDAFCHVSRLRDDFIENPQEMFHEGDAVEARVVEIDRKQKRITVSLQSDRRVADERASVEARTERKRARKQKDTANSKRSFARKSEQDPSPRSDEPVNANERKRPGVAAPKKQPAPPVVRASRPKDLSEMTPAELKRQRKLARRAERREAETTAL